LISFFSRDSEIEMTRSSLLVVRIKTKQLI